MILSLQGCMGVGKTTALQYIEKNVPDVHISWEENRHVIEEVKRRGLQKTKYEDYLEIQKLWLENEVKRYEKAQLWECTMMDFGAEEIEFYTLNYPKTIGADWDVENPLKKELDAVRACMPQRILFLDASEETLRKRKEMDSTRSREFFEYYIQKLLPLKKEWFGNRENVDILNTDGKSIKEVGEKVKAWMEGERI